MATTRVISNSLSLAMSRSNRRVAIFGDSRTDRCTVPSISTASAVQYSKIQQGYLAWLQFLCGQRFDFDLADNYGKSGDTTSQLLVRLQALSLSTMSAKTAIILIGTNNWLGGVSYAQTVLDLVAIDALFRDAGWTRIYMSEMPRGDTTFTSQRLAGANLQNQLRLAEYLRGLRATPGVFVADPWQYLADPLSTTGDLVVGMTVDGLHESPIGSYYMAQALLPVINAIFPPVDLLPQSNTDIFDATNHIFGCLNSNPMMGGTGGSFNATGGSGVVADGWSENAGPTWTRTYSKATLANGKAAQQVVLGGTGTAGGVAFRQSISSGNLTIGDKVQAMASVEIDASAANISQLSLQLLDNATIVSGDMIRSTTEVFPNIAVQIKGILRTPIYTLTSTSLQLQFGLNVVNTLVPAATVRWGQVALRKVA